MANRGSGAAIKIVIRNAGWANRVCRTGLAHRDGIRFGACAVRKSLVEGGYCFNRSGWRNADVVRQAYEHACSKEADVVRPIHVARTPAFPNGSTQFDLRDPEGNLWTLGTFQPGIE